MRISLLAKPGLYLKFTLLLLLSLFIESSLHSQLAVFKMVGKNSANSKLGFGTFVYWDFPVSQVQYNSVVIELMDLAFFPPKDDNIVSPIGYLSIKAGFKHIFSEESKTGFYVEPSAGYCRVVTNDDINKSYGDGVAVAAEAGYSLEVGQRANTLVFGLKYESDMVGGNNKINAISLRASYSFHLFRKRSD